MALAVAFIVALALALALTPLGIRVAWAVGYLDQPHARKLHLAATPLLGGVVVFIAALAGWGASRFLLPAVGTAQAVRLLLGALIVLLLGLWDDRFGMQPPVKLLGQAAAAAVLLTAGVRLPFGLPPALDFAIALVALIGLMNAINFLDNMNGMIGGIAAITLAAFAIYSCSCGAWGVAAAQLALAGACAGFLPYNFPRAAIFLATREVCFWAIVSGLQPCWRATLRRAAGPRWARCCCWPIRSST